ncbi:MAG: hypothetical protein ABJF10_00705 [Chthoniobacter sp.]|uniref:hypothetical protein n=1 Tax=Chthoniobacter sp. TaxID=2510640 RepID=UPI0032A815DC
MNPHQPLIDQIFREKVLRARRQTPGERMSDVLELSAMHFDKDDPELRRRLALVRAMDERDCYGPAQPRL